MTDDIKKVGVAGDGEGGDGGEGEALPTIAYEDFLKLDIRLGTITEVTVVENADKLLRFQVDFGDFTRQILSGIREYFDDPQVLLGKQSPFIVNLAPRTIRGFESEGMILAASDDQHFGFLSPHQKLSPGSKVV